MIVCFIGIGSNLGDRNYYIQEAIKDIRRISFTRINKVSRIFENPAQGGPAGQQDYWNAVLEIETGLLPYELLEALQTIENRLGRVRAVENGPRTIDLDILVYGDSVVQETALCIPHPRMLERDFVMRPLAEIAPEVCAQLRNGRLAPLARQRKTVTKAKKKKAP